MSIIHLTDLVSVEILDNLLQQYYEATGMASCIGRLSRPNNYQL